MSRAGARLTLAFAALLAALSAIGSVGASETRPDARLVVELEAGERAAYPQEMVLVRIRGFYRLPIMLEKLVPPEIAGARVLQIGPDRWADTMREGLPTRTFLRTLALFPQRSGRLNVPSFIHRLTTVDAKGGRVGLDVASEPVTLAVRPAPDGAAGWWLPARKLSLSAEWSVPPEALRIGQSTELRLTVTAEGVTDDQLPPPPDLAVPGLIVFAGAPERRTVIAISPPEETGEQKRQTRRLGRPGRLAFVEGEDGTIATVTWRWSIRPATSEPVDLPDIAIPWFDTGAGIARTAVVPGARVALADAGISRADLERRLRLVPEAAVRAKGEGDAGPDPAVLGCALVVGALTATVLGWRRDRPRALAFVRWLLGAIHLRSLAAACRMPALAAPSQLWTAADRASANATALGLTDRVASRLRERAERQLFRPGAPGPG